MSSSKDSEQISAAAVVITGVSTGIGWGTVKVLVEKGVHVFGSVRKAEDAQRLQDAFGSYPGPSSLQGGLRHFSP